MRVKRQRCYSHSAGLCTGTAWYAFPGLPLEGYDVRRVGYTKYHIPVRSAARHRALRDYYYLQTGIIGPLVGTALAARQCFRQISSPGARGASALVAVLATLVMAALTGHAGPLPCATKMSNPED